MIELRAVRCDNVGTEGTVGGESAANGERSRQAVSGDAACSARNSVLPSTPITLSEASTPVASADAPDRSSVSSDQAQPAARQQTGNGGGSGSSLRSALLASVVGIRHATCPHCGEGFDCGVAAPACWCQKFPALDVQHRAPELIGQGCLCGTCLGEALARQSAHHSTLAAAPSPAALSD